MIDDDHDDSEIFIEAVNSLDKKISCYSETNPIAAFEHLKNAGNLPDIIFLDYSMPVVNGKEFLEKIKSVEELKSIPVILYSSYCESAAKQLCITHNAEKYIPKPYSFTELTQVLRSVLELNN